MSLENEVIWQTVNKKNVPMIKHVTSWRYIFKYGWFWKVVQCWSFQSIIINLKVLKWVLSFQQTKLAISVFLVCYVVFTYGFFLLCISEHILRTAIVKSETQWSSAQYLYKYKKLNIYWCTLTEFQVDVHVCTSSSFPSRPIHHFYMQHSPYTDSIMSRQRLEFKLCTSICVLCNHTHNIHCTVMPIALVV